MGCKAPRYLADVMYDYWAVAIEPHWASIRAVLEDDVAYRAGELTRGGLATMVAGMHPSLTMRDDYIVTSKTCKNLYQRTELATSIVRTDRALSLVPDPEQRRAGPRTE